MDKMILSTKYFRIRKFRTHDKCIGIYCGSTKDLPLYVALTLVKYNIVIGRDKHYEQEHKSFR